MFNRSTARSTFAATILSLAAVAIAGPVYNVTQLESPSTAPFGEHTTNAGGISNDVIAGSYADVNIRSVPPHAMAWVGPQHDRVILPTAGNVESVATSVFDGASGDYVIGGYTVNNSVDSDYYHAAVWTNHGSTFTDLNPSAFTYSAVYGVTSNTQVGVGDNGQGGGHALLWKGSASSVVDLNGSSDSSIAYGADQSHQVGSSGLHAAVWSGSAASMVDLNPAGYSQSAALAISGSQEVGYAELGSSSQPRAIFWNSSAGSAVLLKDAGFVSSEATGVSNGKIVGFGVINVPIEGGYEPISHALVWTSPSATPIDLSFSLPPVADGLSSSQATSINANGVIVGWAASRTTGDTVATIWTPTAVPLPKTSLIGAALLLIGATTLSIPKLKKAFL